MLIISLLIFKSEQIVKSQNLSAKQIIEKADKKMKGTTNKSTMTMTITRPTWQRVIKLKTWSKGNEYSIALITYPIKEKGQSFLKRNNNLWTWNPKIKRMIKMPPSMMSQGWMSSDYTNDDLLKESSLVVDYNHKINGNENISGKDCYKISLKAKDDAAVVWGKIIKWVSKKEFNQLKTEYYDEDGYLVKTDLASQVKNMDGRIIPTKVTITPADEPENKTTVIINSIKFDVKINNNFFSQQNMKRLR